ncbi:lipoyl(octanoyl) transferase LipB [bacterium]|nr:lipoyl(octanoyl) transferase LipB [bacterium]
MSNKLLQIVHLGLIDYQTAWDLQKTLFDKRLSNQIEDTLLLCEHPHTYTVGKNGVDSVSKHLLMNKDELATHGIKIFEIDRGGDITYHGPGQIVGYPILNLNNYYRDVHRYLRDIEEAIIRTLAEYGLTGKRIDAITGVWIDTPRSPEKICAIGVKVTRWITMHGFALNVNTNLDFFNGIVPCGISDKGVTSIEKLLQKKIDVHEVEAILTEKFAEVFDVTAAAVAKENILTMEIPHATLS